MVHRVCCGVAQYVNIGGTITNDYENGIGSSGLGHEYE